MARNSKNNSLLKLLLILMALALAVWLFRNNNIFRSYRTAGEKINPGGLSMVEINYGVAIDNAANTFQLSAEYLKALCMLESSGRKFVKPRFEPHVYERLREVQKGTRNNYEHVTPAMLKDASDAALKNLASSWGPFQLMGYKCLLLNIKVADIRGEEAVYWGAKWINETYGDYVRQSKFKDAFHIHNTGKRYPKLGKPKTYHPNYVQNGLEFMEYFTKNKRHQDSLLF
jgi:hypothetical protein